MPTMNDIELGAKTFAEAREKLAVLVTELNDGIEALRRESLPAIKRCLERAAQRHSELQALIQASPGLFVKPRTVVMHGIKVGIEKGKGKIEFDDAEALVKLILKHLPDQQNTLIQTTCKPLKAALAGLSVKELKALGCRVEEAGDVVVIRPVATEVDKLVAALIKGSTEKEAA